MSPRITPSGHVSRLLCFVWRSVDAGGRLVFRQFWQWVSGAFSWAAASEAENLRFDYSLLRKPSMAAISRRVLP